MNKLIGLLLVICITSCSRHISKTRQPDREKLTYATSPTTGEKYVNSYFYDDFDEQLDTKKWKVGGWSEHGAKTSPARCYTKGGYLHLEFINDEEEGLLGAAIQSRDEFLYGRWEARIKASDQPGTLNSVYTIDWDNTNDPTSEADGTKQEIDIELLTQSFSAAKGEVHFAIHAKGKESYNSNPDFKLDFNPSDGFHVFGFDITPEYVEWFVDGKSRHKYYYSDTGVTINEPYFIKMNHRTGIGWVGGPPKEGIKSTYLIDWIKFTPHK